MITQASWVPPTPQPTLAALPRHAQLPGYDRGGVHYQPLGQVEGIFEDIQELANKAPQVISQVVTIVRKAGDQLPTIVKIIDKTGKHLPTVLKVIEKAGPHLPKVVAIIDKAAPHLPTVIRIVEQAEPHLPTIVAVVEDPALPQVVQRIQTIRAIEEAAAKKEPPPPPGAKPKPVGIGLKRVIPALDAFIFLRKNPWVPWVAGGAGILLLFGIGFGVGRLTARRRTPAREARTAPALAPAPA